MNSPEWDSEIMKFEPTPHRPYDNNILFLFKLLFLKQPTNLKYNIT